jgi:hypothetical protein
LFNGSGWIWENVAGIDFILIELCFFFLAVLVMQELQDGVEKAKDSNEELMRVGREIVDFHGEMVLLENYSALNYTGTCFLFLWLVKPHDLCGLNTMDSFFGDIVNAMINGLQNDCLWLIRTHML